jgi:hypothetical protein
MVPIYLHSGGVPHIVGKLSMRVTTLPYISSQSEVFTQNYGPPKLQESQFWEFQNFNLGVLGQNDIWVLAPWLGIENNTKGEGDGFSQIRAMVSLVNSCLLVVRPCTKSAPTTH